MPDTDYYKMLDVSREASADEIRKAYKRLSKEYHPDRNPNDKAAAEKFKQVQNAYAVLGDVEKREQYDRYGTAFSGMGGGGPRGGRTYNWSPGTGGSGPVDLEEILGGQFGFGDLFGQMGGGGRGGFGGFGGGTRQPAAQKGQDLELEIEVPFQVAADGGQHALQLRRDGKTERLNVKVPAGVEDGSVIRLAGQGHPGIGGGPAGDLLLTVKVSPHPYFRREGAHISIEVPISPSEAVLGAKVDVPTLNEGMVSVTVPPGSSSGRKLRLRGKGVVNPKTRERGDQYVVVKIVVPQEIDEQTRRAYEQLADISTHSPRAGMW